MKVLASNLLFALRRQQGQDVAERCELQCLLLNSFAESLAQRAHQFALTLRLKRDDV